MKYTKVHLITFLHAYKDNVIHLITLLKVSQCELVNKVVIEE